MVEFPQLDGIKIKMQNKAMIVERVHCITAIGEYLFGGFFFEESFAESEVFFCFFEFSFFFNNFGLGLVLSFKNAQLLLAPLDPESSDSYKNQG